MAAWYDTPDELAERQEDYTQSTGFIGTFSDYLDDLCAAVDAAITDWLRLEDEAA